MKVDYANRAACKGCVLRPRCTRTYRHVSRLENEAVLDRMAIRLAACPDILDRWREAVEHPFGTIKQWMGQGAFLMRRLENVRGEFSLTALAYNIRRAITMVGVPNLIAATNVREAACPVADHSRSKTGSRCPQDGQRFSSRPSRPSSVPTACPPRLGTFHTVCLSDAPRRSHAESALQTA